VGVAPYGYTSQARIRAALIAAGMDPVEAQVQAQVQVPRSPGLVVDETEAEIVRQVFAAALTGQGFRAIAAHLTGQGSTKRGLPWHARSVQKLLTDPKVGGLVHFDEEAYQAGLRRSRRRRVKQAIAPGAHPAIIEQVEWHAVQALIAGRVRPRAYNSRGIYPLSGVLHCANGHPFDEFNTFMRPGGADVIHVNFRSAEVDPVYFPQIEVIGEPNRQYLWILSRTPTLAPQDRAIINGLLQQQGYDPTKLQEEPQP
jgi:hypothetical protein